MLAQVESIRLPNVHRPLSTQSVVYMEGYGNYTRIYVQGQHQPLVVALTLRWFEDQLPDFIRTHKSTLVNERHVVRTNRRDSRFMRLELTDMITVDVSRRRMPIVLSRLNADLS